MKEKAHLGIRILFFIIIIIFCLYLYGRYINPICFKVHETAIIDTNLTNEYNGLKILQFSDIHYGRTTTEDMLKKLIKETNKTNPDIIIFNGDLFDSTPTENEIELLIDYLSKLEAKLFKFACIGDYDKKYLETYQNILEKSNFILLDNSKKQIFNNSTIPINIIGITNINNIDDLYSKEEYNITIMHEPDLIKSLNYTNLVFAGHSLGGQIKIPFIGGIRKTNGATKYINSYYKVDEKKLYITNGIGTEKYSFRFLNTPSITLYRLYNL